MLKKNRTNTHDFTFHLVIVTKYRKKIFTTDTQQQAMKTILESISKGNGSEIQALEIMPDHVHLVLYFPPHLTPASIVKSYKGTSAREWFKAYPETRQLLYNGHLWSPSYFMSTVGNVSIDNVLDYVKNQKNKIKN